MVIAFLFSSSHWCFFCFSCPCSSFSSFWTPLVPHHHSSTFLSYLFLLFQLFFFFQRTLQFIKLCPNFLHCLQFFGILSYLIFWVNPLREAFSSSNPILSTRGLRRSIFTLTFSIVGLVLSPVATYRANRVPISLWICLAYPCMHVKWETWK